MAKKLTYNSKKTTFTLSAIFVEVFISGTEMIREKTRVTLQGQILSPGDMPDIVIILENMVDTNRTLKKHS